MRSHIRYAILGILLGLGAPMGSLALRWLGRPMVSPLAVLAHEWRLAGYYYIYMTVGTVTAFGLFGLLLGGKNDTLGDLSIRDGLTGLYNHRYLQEFLLRETDRSNRYALSVTCLMMDLDNFKSINDQYGHPFGDTVLRDIAQIIQETARRTDVVGRYGGEEFLAIMPQTDAAAAHPIAERIVAAVRDHDFVFHGMIRLSVTVSIGLAAYPFPEHGIKNRSGLIAAADQAMYRAKLRGKNRVVTWQSETRQSAGLQ